LERLGFERGFAFAGQEFALQEKQIELEKGAREKRKNAVNMAL
jgi:hypothetical protein